MKLPFVRTLVAAAVGGMASLALAENAPPSASGKLPSLRAGTQVLAAGKTLWVGHTACPVALDWNNDGKLDLLVGTFLSGRVYLFLNEGTAAEPNFGKGATLRAGTRELQVGYG